jgi:glycosyltransferase involved in cell wall biosynthesis
MALGTPVVATDDGGSPEIIPHGIDGFLVKDNDISAAASILSRILEDPEELKRLRRNAESTVRQRFLLEGMVQNYISLYNALLERK